MPVGPLWLRCALAFALAFLADAVAAWHIRTLVALHLWPAVESIMVLQFVNFAALVLLVESKSFWQRLAVTAATALGAGMATALVVLFSR